MYLFFSSPVFFSFFLSSLFLSFGENIVVIHKRYDFLSRVKENWIEDNSVMRIQVDNRERDIIECLRTRTLPSHITIEVAVLPLGDISILCEDECLLLIERKTLADLNASIKDGRYEEQSLRLQQSAGVHPHNVIYLIEGTMMEGPSPRLKIKIAAANHAASNANSQINNMLYSAMFSLQYYKGFSVMRSVSLEETVTLLINMADKIERERVLGKKHPFYRGVVGIASSAASSEPSGAREEEEHPGGKKYSEVIKKVKKANVTADNIGVIMLCQIPGISSVIAEAIMSKYKRLPALILALRDNPEELVGFTYENEKGNQRKISKTILTTLTTYFGGVGGSGSGSGGMEEGF